jgi:large subunit ribosomal protein L3
MGARNRTQQNLEIVRTDAARGLLFVKGSVPGSKGGWLTVSDAIKLPRDDRAPYPAGLLENAAQIEVEHAPAGFVDDAAVHEIPALPSDEDVKAIAAEQEAGALEADAAAKAAEAEAEATETKDSDADGDKPAADESKEG